MCVVRAVDFCDPLLSHVCRDLCCKSWCHYSVLDRPSAFPGGTHVSIFLVYLGVSFSRGSWGLQHHSFAFCFYVGFLSSLVAFMPLNSGPIMFASPKKVTCCSGKHLLSTRHWPRHRSQKMSTFLDGLSQFLRTRTSSKSDPQPGRPWCASCAADGDAGPRPTPRPTPRTRVHNLRKTMCTGSSEDYWDRSWTDPAIPLVGSFAYIWIMSYITSLSLCFAQHTHL